MIRLVAASAEDGWAVAREGDQWWRLVPPYHRADRRPVAEDLAARIILDQAIPLIDQSFADWGELCRFVQQARVITVQQRGEGLSSSWADVLRFTTARRAASHLDQLEAQAKTGDPQGIVEGVTALLEAPAVQGDHALLRRAAALLSTMAQQATAAPPQRKAWAPGGSRVARPAPTLLFGRL